MRIFYIITLSIFCFCCNAQVFVQLELFNDPIAKKFGIGDKITYRVNYNQEIWSKGIIEEILISENTLILNNAIIPIKQISDFMLYRNSSSIMTPILIYYFSLMVGFLISFFAGR